MNQATADGDTRRGRTTTVWLIIPVVAVAAGSASAVRVLTVETGTTSPTAAAGP